MISPNDIEFYILTSKTDPLSQNWRFDITASAVRFWGGTVNVIESLSEINTHKQYALVQQPGHMIFTREFFNGLVCSNPFVVQGHILAKVPSYIKLHPQCFLIDVHNTRQLKVDLSKETTRMPQFTVSAQHFHDNYTPYYLLLERGDLINVEENIGNTLLATQLKFYGHAYAFSTRSRTGKHFFYSQDPYSEFVANKQFQILKQKQEQCIYLMHTDTTIGSGWYNTVITTASGLKPVLMNNGYAPQNLIVYDISKPAIDWQRTLKLEWDGEHLLSFYYMRKGFNENVILPVDGKIKEEWHTLSSQYGWKDMWKRYKERGVDFHHQDLLVWDIPIYGKTLLDITNILTQPFLRFELSEHDLYKQLIHRFGKYVDQELYIIGLTPRWQHCNGIHVKAFIDKLRNEIQEAYH